jgi:hypothetical protein
MGKTTKPNESCISASDFVMRHKYKHGRSYSRALICKHIRVLHLFQLSFFEEEGVLF